MKKKEKVAYIKGLVAALETDKNDKVFSAVLDLLSDLAATVSDLDDKSEYLEKYIEEVDEDLGSLEDEFYGDECDDCECKDCAEEDCDCRCDDCLDDDDDCDCCDDDCDCVEVECPYCGETVCLDDTVDFDNVKCPACGETFSCVCDDDCDCCDDDNCGCGCEH